LSEQHRFDAFRISGVEQMKPPDKAGVPQVGIFWILPDGLLAFGTPYSAGEKYVDFLSTPDGHYETWEKLRKTLVKLPEDYTAYPRGQIVYRINDQKFIVYLNKKHLKNERIKKRIIKKFRLPVDHVIFSHDHHYEK
jgi:hypothetical protein